MKQKKLLKTSKYLLRVNYFFIIVYSFYIILNLNSNNETVIDELIKKFFQLQLEFNSKLTETLTERENVIQNLKETTNLVKNEIISQYKVK